MTSKNAEKKVARRLTHKARGVVTYHSCINMLRKYSPEEVERFVDAMLAEAEREIAALQVKP